MLMVYTIYVSDYLYDLTLLKCVERYCVYMYVYM